MAKSFLAAIQLASGMYLTFLGATMRESGEFTGALLFGTITFCFGLLASAVGLGWVIRTNVEAARG